MKELLILLLTCLLTQAAQVTIMDLPPVTPSTNTWIEVQDQAATPRGRRVQLGTVPQLTVLGSGTIETLTASNLAGSMFTRGVDLRPFALTNFSDQITHASAYGMGASTGQLNIAHFGDSVAVTEMQYLWPQIYKSVGGRGIGMGSSGSGSLRPGMAAPGLAGGATGWTNLSWWLPPGNALFNCYRIPPAGVLTNNYVGNKVHIYLVGTNGSGTASLILYRPTTLGDYAAFTNAAITVDCNSATQVGIVTNLTAANTNQYQGWFAVTNASAADVFMIGAWSEDTNVRGAVTHVLANGGANEGSFTNILSTVWNPIWADLSCSLATVRCKWDTDPELCISSIRTLLKSNSRTDLLWIQSSPDSAAWTTNYWNTMKQFALTNGDAYFDCYSLFGDPYLGNGYTNVLASGWQGDGVHLAEFANAYTFANLWPKLAHLLTVPDKSSSATFTTVPQIRAQRLLLSTDIAQPNEDLYNMRNADIYAETLGVAVKPYRYLSFYDRSGNTILQLSSRATGEGYGINIFSGNLMWNTDGGGNIGTSTTARRPGYVHVATGFSAGGQLGLTTSANVLVAGGTTNRMVWTGGILVSNIVNFY